RLGQHCLVRRGILFPHPPTSPDVSPIEPDWHILKTRRRDYQPRPYNLATLEAAILDVWDKITVDEIN
ncbi:hypothetical protein GGX14DRAFT_359739, partial [Mycena pura]